MPCVIKGDECYEQNIDDPRNPNECQKMEEDNIDCIAKLIEVSSTTIAGPTHADFFLKKRRGMIVQLALQWFYKKFCVLIDKQRCQSTMRPLPHNET